MVLPQSDSPAQAPFKQQTEHSSFIWHDIFLDGLLIKIPFFNVINILETVHMGFYTS